MAKVKNIRMFRALAIFFGANILSLCQKTINEKLAKTTQSAIIKSLKCWCFPNSSIEHLNQEDYFKSFSIRFGNDSFQSINIKIVG